MQRNVLVHLIIIGRNPATGDYSIGLNKNKTIQGQSMIEPDAEACNLAEKYINAPLDWYGVRKQTFVISDDAIHLIYVATIPDNIKLKDGAEWCHVTKLSSKEFVNEVEKDIIIQGMRL